MIRLTTPTHTFVFPENIDPAELDCRIPLRKRQNVQALTM